MGEAVQMTESRIGVGKKELKQENGAMHLLATSASHL